MESLDSRISAIAKAPNSELPGRSPYRPISLFFLVLCHSMRNKPSCAIGAHSSRVARASVMHRSLVSGLIIAVLAFLAFGSSFRVCQAFAKAKGTVSRIDFLEKAVEVIGGGPIDEASAVTSGILEPCPDGHYHLDWPVTRGLAVRSLARLIIRLPVKVTFPGVFCDVGSGTPLSEALDIVGGAFKNIDQERLRPDRLFTPSDLETVLSALMTRIPSGTASAPSLVPMVPLTQSVEGKEFSNSFRFSDPRTSAMDRIRQTQVIEDTERLSKYDISSTGSDVNLYSVASASRMNGFDYDGAQTHIDTDSNKSIGVDGLAGRIASSELVLGSNTARVNRLGRFVPHDQLSPTNAFDLEAAEKGTAEIEHSLDSLEVNILDLVSLVEVDRADDRRLRDALAEIRPMLSTSEEKLNISQDTLGAVLLVDGDSMRRAASLKDRLNRNLARIARLRERIDDRLKLEEKTQ
ncbi:MAG: hypothetical protein HQM09_19895 [Candidatus Riflebacteria bacterium]|nr:hypothetical protein [Candidatus Riflebacteria bacterium]